MTIYEAINSNWSIFCNQIEPIGDEAQKNKQLIDSIIEISATSIRQKSNLNDFSIKIHPCTQNDPIIAFVFAEKFAFSLLR